MYRYKSSSKIQPESGNIIMAEDDFEDVNDL